MNLNKIFPTFLVEGWENVLNFYIKFELKPDAKPVFKKKRNLPFASVSQISEELYRLEEMEVLAKVEYAEWASPTVY